jgi:predicted SnoaL-like aldol condensation-catalyzing enzyme
MAGTPSPQEVFGHHAQALGAEDLDEIVADYSDAVFISPAGVQRGRDGIRQAFTKLLSEVPQAAWDIKTTIYEGDILFLEWAAEGRQPDRRRDRHLRLSRRHDPGPDRPLHLAVCSLTGAEAFAAGG